MILLQICQFHQQHKGMSQEEAMLEYLKIAQDLEMFGITYFPVFNAKGTEVNVQSWRTVGSKAEPDIRLFWGGIRI